MGLHQYSLDLRQDLDGLSFPSPVHMTYNPLHYAWENYAEYLTQYGNGTKRIVFLGMNPGPWGMAQTGVPFGEISAVRDWMKLSGEIRKPDIEHPKRLISGFECPRTEVSGQRLWGYFSACFPEAKAFFDHHFVLNYCPLIWMQESGANLTPDKLPKHSMDPVEKACMRHLIAFLEILKPKWVIGIGVYAEKRLKEAEKHLSIKNLKVGKILHPSPANPLANRGWNCAASEQLAELGISLSPSDGSPK